VGRDGQERIAGRDGLRHFVQTGGEVRALRLLS
jgi:hypothetical protein